MLHLSSRGSRALHSRYVCVSCTASLLFSQPHDSSRQSSRDRAYYSSKQPGHKPSKNKKKTGDGVPSNDEASKDQKRDKAPGRRSRTLSDKQNLQLCVNLWAQSNQLLQDIIDGRAKSIPTRLEAQAVQEAVEPHDEGEVAGTVRTISSHSPRDGEIKASAEIDHQQRLLEGALDVLKNVLDNTASVVDRREKRLNELNKKDTAKPSLAKETQSKASSSHKEAKPAEDEEPIVGKKQKDSQEKRPQALSENQQQTSKGRKGRKALLSDPQPISQTEKPGGNDADIAVSQSTAITGEVEDEESSTSPVMMGKVLSGNLNIQKIESRKLRMKAVDKAQPPVPKVQYGLDRVLFNPGVYHLQDPRSRVFNFDPYLATIMPIDEFDFNALKQYVTSSKDQTLIDMAETRKKKYTGSTSSMTSMLAHFHYLLSAWRSINPAHTSRTFEPESFKFTRIQRAPAAAFLHWKDGVYAIDADKEFDTANILSMLGKSMEKLLTLPKDDYEKYRIKNSDQLTEEEKNADESYHYTTMGDFLMRSQLDAHDSRLPGSGMFDLKTRAVVSIRMDAKDFQKGLGYEIRSRIGQWESFEREYYDMIRSAFLKYSLQVRMGRMDGIFVAFHNTQRIFGFQYISIDEMDLALHGTSNKFLGDTEFKLSLALLNDVLNTATAKFPGRSLRLHIETRESKRTPFMYIFAKPVTTTEISSVQDANKTSVEEFEAKMLGLKHEISKQQQEDDDLIQQEDESENKEDPEETPDEEDADVWENMRSAVQATMEDEASGMATIREAIEIALDRSGLLQARSEGELEQYVDILLEEITTIQTENALESDAAPSQSQAASVPSPESNESDEESTETGENELRSGLPTAEENVEDVANANEPSQEEGHKVDEDEPQPVQPSETSERPESARLKDLVVYLSGKREAFSKDRGTEESDENDDQVDLEVASDEAKLRKFGKYLTEMISRSKESDSSAETSERTAEDASTGDVEKPESDIVTDIESELSRRSDTPGSEPARSGAAETGENDAQASAPEELLGLILTARNKVDGKFVDRPDDYNTNSTWDVYYTMEEIPKQRAQAVYKALRQRRRTSMRPKEDKATTSWDNGFRSKLQTLSQRGRQFRQKETVNARKFPVHVVGSEKTRSYDQVFESVGSSNK